MSQIDEEEFEVVTMIDEDGSEVELYIIDNVTSGTARYLLVVESNDYNNDAEESNALILREVAIGSDDVTYEIVDDGAEFDRVAELFAQKSDDYDVEIDG